MHVEAQTWVWVGVWVCIYGHVRLRCGHERVCWVCEGVTVGVGGGEGERLALCQTGDDGVAQQGIHA